MCDITPKPYKCRNHATLNPNKAKQPVSSFQSCDGAWLDAGSCKLCKRWKQGDWATGPSPPRSHISRWMILNCLGLIGGVNELWWCFGVGQLPVVLTVCWSKASLRMVTPAQGLQKGQVSESCQPIYRHPGQRTVQGSRLPGLTNPCWKVGQLDVRHT